VSATVCGANGCRDVDSGRQLELFTGSSGPTGPPASATGWYRARLAFGAPGEPVQERITVAVIPDQRLMRGPGDGWNPINEEAARAFTEAAAGLEPLPPSELGLKPTAAATPKPAVAEDDGGFPWLGFILISAAACSIAACAYYLHARSRSGRSRRRRWPSRPDRPTRPPRRSSPSP
jgi:hypothetical protein